MRIDYNKGGLLSSELIQLRRKESDANIGPKKKVMLVFPPDWYPSEPYLSLPTLAAFLRRAGHEVVQKDVNLEMYDWYFSADFLKRVLKRVPQQLDRLKRISRDRSLTEPETELQLALCECTRSRIAELSDQAEQAKAIVRSPDFYDAEKLEWAINIFREVTATISLVYAPARICMPPMETDLSYKIFMSSEVLEAVNDTQVNVYRDVFEHILRPAIEEEKPEIIGLSIVLRQQLFSTMTFCAMIKEAFPDIHITIGGNTVTRLRDVLPNTPRLFALFDSAIVYEGETAFLQLIEAIGTDRNFNEIPNLLWRDESGIHTSSVTSSESMSDLPPPDFDGLPLEKYFVPEPILPYLATRGCYWGRCEFCDHGEGYTAGYRTKKIQEVIEEVRLLRDKYHTRMFHFTDESYPPALFRKLTRALKEEKMDIAWTTHIRFEKSLLDDEVWQDAEDSGCKFLHFGYESGSERVLKLMDKATTTEVIQRSMELSSKHGVWNHVMGFFGFPGERYEDAKFSMQFLEDNKEHVHSIGFGTFDLSKHTPVAKNAEKWGVTYYANPEWDLALDYYFTVKDGLGIEDAERVFEEFEQNHYPGWDLKIFIREYVFLYVAHFGTNKLPALQFRIAPDEKDQALAKV
ncbi:radical SAM protein [Candidatus Nitronereus thalassa]|uniref:Radical SAM protein n=1 Tax=Candidatus Nitronereus thalassa TaxID=3020898 RepID=A0ABU3KCP2_9BACT|nr:radical SAM protein [Candidatus Nitronereus thalassa]MDT7043947.1 radical SAM protein [Candidatus Nitronereus thalassa]